MLNNKDIEWKRKKLKQFREEIQNSQLNAVQELLTTDVIEAICNECQYTYRNRLFTPLITILHMISAAVSGEGSFQSAWQRSGQYGRSSGLSEARKRLPYEIWQRLDQWMQKQIETEINGDTRWRGHRMVGIDGTGISMNDEPELANFFGRQNGGARESLFPTARMVIAFNLNTMIHIAHMLGPVALGEKTLFKKHLLEKLSRGDVVIFDGHYSGANLYAQYQFAGVDFIGQTHPCLKAERLKVIKAFSEDDKIVEMPILTKNRQEDERLPKKIAVRLIRSTRKKNGKKEIFWIATSLCDPQQYPKEEIVGWQKKRWKVETLIKETKLTCWAAILRSRSVEGIQKELYARLIALNLIHWLILKAAQLTHQTPDRLSVSAALRMTCAVSLKMSTAPAWQLPSLYQNLLFNIAASKVPERLHRIEPRLIKRTPLNHFKKLRISRSDWRSLYAFAA